MIGRTVSHYRILEKLGEGGMGVVYKAEDTKLKRIVALKFLPPDLTRDTEAKERFIQEAQAASAIDHANICTIYEINESEDGQMFIVMAYYEGETLKEKLKHGALKVDEAIDIIIQVANGLAVAHEAGISHRDIKPANIMVTKRGEVKILDFGLAKLVGQTRLTKTGETLGTVAYMSPEQAQGEEVDHRTDIWSLGVVFYEMLTGELPFKGEYPMAIIYSILNENPKPITHIRGDTPPEIESLVNKAMMKRKENRYQDINHLLVHLHRLKNESGKKISLSREGTKFFAKAKLRKQAYIIAALLILVLSFSIYFTFKHKTDLRKNTTIEKSIVILPFEDISPGKDNTYFSDGLTEEVIADLSRVHSLRVISRTSAMMLKGSQKSIKAISKELNVQYILEGSVRKAGNSLRITAQLIDPTNDTHLWAEKYSRTLDEIFDIQEDVSRAIVEALKLELTPEEKQKVFKRPISNVYAYDCYLRARNEIFKSSEDGMNRALQYLQNGLDSGDGNALLYAGMGLWYCHYVNLGLKLDENLLTKAEEYANKAFELEPDFPYGHLVLGLLQLGNNPKEGIRHLSLVLDYEPNNYEALKVLRMYYFLQNKQVPAIKITKRLEKIDPLNSGYKIPSCYELFYKGEFNLAVATYRNKPPEFIISLFYYGLSLAYLNQYDKAIIIFDKIAKDEPNQTITKIGQIFKYTLQRNKSLMLQLLTSRLQFWIRRDCEYAHLMADCFAMFDDKKQALDWLEQSVNLGFINYPYLMADPFLNNLHNEDRFQRLMERVKYEWEHLEVIE